MATLTTRSLNLSTLPASLQTFFLRHPPSSTFSPSQPPYTPLSSPTKLVVNPLIPPFTPIQLENTKSLHKSSNPFLPWQNPFTKAWRPPVYSLRQQADLLKLAKQCDVLEYMPETKRTSLINRLLFQKDSSVMKRVDVMEKNVVEIEENVNDVDMKGRIGSIMIQRQDEKTINEGSILRVKGTGQGQNVKGKGWERRLRAKTEMRIKAIEGMPALIKEWKERGHGRGWRKWPK